ncbi:MAG: YfiR family protein, partial [Candidatus Eisenbacteria bacterium]
MAASARAGPPTEYEVKAAFVYNFAKFVEWPAEAFDSVTAPLTIGILGEDPFGPSLADAIEDKQASGRPLRLRRIDADADARGCQILFVNVSPADLKETLRRVDPAGLLLVGEGEAFLREGGVIALVMDG